MQYLDSARSKLELIFIKLNKIATAHKYGIVRKRIDTYMRLQAKITKRDNRQEPEKKTRHPLSRRKYKTC